MPTEQLPSYVDDVIDIISFVTKTELINNIGKVNYTNKSLIVNSPTSDPLYNKIVITNANTSQNDWEIIDPEDGKIYINESNNHSYRWSGNSFVDLDKNFNDRLNVIENKLSIITLSRLTNNYDLSTATNSVSNTIINKEISIDKTMNNITPTDIFTTSLLQTINIVENANRLNIIVKDNSSIKQTLTILNVSKTLQNGDLITANYSITCAFNGIIYYGNVENNVYNIIAYKTFYSLLYQSSGGGVN